QMTQLYKQFRCSIVAIEEVPMEEVHKYGVIAGETMKDGLFRITDMVEKPSADKAPSNMAIIGRYILTPDIFGILAETSPGAGGEVQITDALQVQAGKGAVIACRFRGRRFDCGSIDGFVAATNFFYRRLVDSRE
ncbi:MAG: sugar phosphate nucleotidyltransferase, partial [Elusimicrobiales bacterium]|nr:sugar phosphate nucleotidyltransferase [Elusimicrobiales bacterium]